MSGSKVVKRALLILRPYSSRDVRHHGKGSADVVVLMPLVGRLPHGATRLSFHDRIAPLGRGAGLTRVHPLSVFLDTPCFSFAIASDGSLNVRRTSLKLNGVPALA